MQVNRDFREDLRLCTCHCFYLVADRERTNMERKNVVSFAVGDGGEVCASGGATSIGPTMSRSPSLGNLPSQRGSLSAGMFVSGAGSVGVTSDALGLSMEA